MSESARSALFWCWQLLTAGLFRVRLVPDALTSLCYVTESVEVNFEKRIITHRARKYSVWYEERETEGFGKVVRLTVFAYGEQFIVELVGDYVHTLIFDDGTSLWQPQLPAQELHHVRSFRDRVRRHLQMQ